ncbi:hypothetical protein [Streptomyces sp. B6B3]|uniref:hypothetical protein n=1 Tax=Streptomyces sp. B6B3 TaxID=3153570 RepID=UPI00325F71BE
MNTRHARRACTTEPGRPASPGRPTPAVERHGGAAAGRAHHLARRGRVAADQFLRGACYSAGTAAVGLLVLWMQARR